MNKVFLVGRLANDVEKFQSNSGNIVVRLSLAVSDLRNRNESYFFPCVTFGVTANYANTYLKKGDLIAVDGRLTRRSFINKEGKTSYVTEITADNINKLVSKQNSDTISEQSNPNQNQSHFKTASIDEAFPENTPINHHPETSSKPMQFDNNDNQEIEWPDDDE